MGRPHGPDVEPPALKEIMRSLANLSGALYFFFLLQYLHIDESFHSAHKVALFVTLQRCGLRSSENPFQKRPCSA
jgi:hypothetical protein